jgi:hypothetical protein
VPLPLGDAEVVVDGDVPLPPVELVVGSLLLEPVATIVLGGPVPVMLAGELVPFVGLPAAAAVPFDGEPFKFAVVLVLWEPVLVEFVGDPIPAVDPPAAVVVSLVRETASVRTDENIEEAPEETAVVVPLEDITSASVIPGSVRTGVKAEHPDIAVRSRFTDVLPESPEQA